MNVSGKVCEYCYDDGYVIGFLGKAWRYKCQKNVKRESFSHLCSGYWVCYDGKGNLRYKLIDRDKMKKTEFCLWEEEKDKEEALKEADRLEREAKANLVLAEKIRKEGKGG